MKIIQFLALLPVLILLAGCGGYGITYNTIPEGALITCNGQYKGYAPIKMVNDEVDSDSKKRGYILGPPCSAKWVSGVQKEFDRYVDVEKFPDGVEQTSHRPDGDGYSQDAEFALKVQGMRYQQQAAEDSARAAKRAASSLDGINRSINQINFRQMLNY